jgi:hypothetical protein
LCAEDVPVATALVDLMGTQRRWLPILYVALALSNGLNGLTRQGFSRWFYVGLAAFVLVLAPLAFRQRRQMIRGYERQDTPTVDGRQDDAAGTAG